MTETAEITEEITEVETENGVDEETRFTVDDDQKADWALKKIKEIEKETERWTDFYEAKKKKVINANEMRKTNLLEKLRIFFQSLEMKKETKTQFSYELPGGKLILKKGKSDFTASDKTALAELFKERKPELVKTKVEPNWAAIKKGLHLLEDNRIVYISEDGEVTDVTGVELTDTPERFEVK